MKKKNIFFYTILALLASCMIFCTSCTSPVLQTIETETNQGTLTLNFSTLEAKTLAPSAADLAISSYKLIATGPNSATFEEVLTGTTFTRAKLALGSWTISVAALDSNNKVIYLGSTTLTLDAYGIKKAISLLPASGNGMIDITASWPVEAGITAVEAEITPNGGSKETLTLAITNNAIHYTATKAAGKYTFILKLKKDAVLVDSIVEAVQVYNEKSTIGTLRLADKLQSYAFNAEDPMIELDFSKSAVINATFSNIADKKMYVAYNNTEEGTQSQTGFVTDQALSIKNISDAFNLNKPYAPNFIQPNFEKNKFSIQNRIDFRAPKLNIVKTSNSKGTAEVKYGDAGTYTVDTSTKNFYLQNIKGSETFSTVQATLRAKNKYCYVWVVDSNFDNTSALDTDNKITQAQIDAFATKFAGTVGNNYTDGIFAWITNLFGFENGGGEGGSGGLDSDQHISIVIYDIDADYIATQEGGTFGFFWPKDNYTQAELDAGGSSSIKTNLGEIFYVDSFFTDCAPGAIYSTLAHEFQHMIHYNQKELTHNVSTNTWFNEMCSLLAEDFVSSSDKLNLDDASAPTSRLVDFNSVYYLLGLTTWAEGNASVLSYANSFAFGAYLARNYGGAELFKNMVDNDKVDGEAIEAAIAQTTGKTGKTLANLYSEFTKALAYPETAPSNYLNLNKAKTSTVNGVTYNLAAINLNNYKAYDYTKDPVVEIAVKGPYVRPLFDSRFIPAFSMSLQNNPAWDTNTLDVRTYSFTKPIGGNTKVFVYFK